MKKWALLEPCSSSFTLARRELPASLMNNIIDAYALSPPSAKLRAEWQSPCLIPLGKGEVPDL